MVGVGMSRPDVDPTLKLDVEHESSPDSGQKKKKILWNQLVWKTYSGYIGTFYFTVQYQN